VTGKELDSSCYDFIYVLNPYLSTEAEESHGSRFSAADDEVKNKKRHIPMKVVYCCKNPSGGRRKPGYKTNLDA